MENSKRLTREEIREPDQVTTALDHAFAWVQKHPKPLLAGAAIVLGLAVVALAVASNLRSRELAAEKALAAVIDTSERPIGLAPAEGPQAKAEPFPDAAARDNAVLQEVDAMLAAHGSARAARGARMLKAQALARRGRYKDAAELYAQVSGETVKDLLGAAAALGQASARAAAGEADAAIEDLKRLAAAGNPNLPKDLALKSAAELAERAGQGEVAAKLYQRVVEEVPDSPLVAESRAKAEELNRAKPPSAP